MGFMKNFKSDRQDIKTIKTAGLNAFAAANAQAAALQEQYAGVIQAAQAMNTPEHLAAAQRAQRILNTGVVGTGTILAARDLGPGVMGNGSSVELEISLTDGPGAPRTLTIRQDVMGNAATFTPGQETKVKIDPSSPDDAMLWADSPGGSDIRIAKLEQLSAMHAAGAFTDEEFAAKKAAVLAED
jgi:hypothetical protein